jgi:hypothetical protein
MSILVKSEIIWKRNYKQLLIYGWCASDSIKTKKASFSECFESFVILKWRITESNRRPLDCQSNALAN